jgi:hypothetical protein
VKLVRPRTDIGIIMLITGPVLVATFGSSYGVALTAVGLVVTAHSILRGNSPGVLMVSAMVLMLLASVWFVATRSSSPGGPPSMDSAAELAEEYRAALASADLVTYLDITQPQLGDTLEDVFAVETQCMDWRLAEATVERHEVASFLAVATFSVDDAAVVRQLGYQSGKWTVTVETSC